jgi:hypothetical protein
VRASPARLVLHDPRALAVSQPVANVHAYEFSSAALACD